MDQPRYAHITFSSVSLPEQEILIAWLSEAGFMGFQQSGNQLDAFVDEKNWNPESLNNFPGPLRHAYAFSWTPHQNWNEEWEKSFTPVCVDDFCRVRARFHPAEPGFKHDIIITPKMSFGTGHHATTHLMIKIMAGLDFSGKRVLDFGTGTGILAILAKKMGAAEVLATDLDTWSIENARENLQENNCSGVTLQLTEGLTGVKGPFDVVLANINRNVLVQEMGHMAELVGRGGLIILSGFLTNDLRAIQTSCSACNLLVNSSLEDGSWAAAVLNFTTN